MDVMMSVSLMVIVEVMMSVECITDSAWVDGSGAFGCGGWS